MKQAVVFLRGIKAGILIENENGYTFEYDAAYLASDKAEAVSLTLPLSEKPSLWVDIALRTIGDWVGGTGNAGDDDACGVLAHRSIALLLRSD